MLSLSLCTFLFSPFRFNGSQCTTCVVWNDNNYSKLVFNEKKMIKTTSLTRTLFNHQNQSQTVHLYTPSTTSSSGSVCETDPSSLSSSFKSNHVPEDINTLPPDESTLVLINLVDKLKRELAAVKQAKSQLASLYKVSLKEYHCYDFFSIIFLTNQTFSINWDLLFYFFLLVIAACSFNYSIEIQRTSRFRKKRTAFDWLSRLDEKERRFSICFCLPAVNTYSRQTKEKNLTLLYFFSYWNFVCFRWNANQILINQLKLLNSVCSTNMNWIPSVNKIKKIWFAIYKDNY